MAKKKLLTIDDLVKFCQSSDFSKFNAKESGYQLAVQIPTTFEVIDNIDDSHRGMMKLKFRIFHIGRNRNGSFVSEKSAKEAMKTIANRPVLAAIYQQESTGLWDFQGHEMEIITNEDGEEEMKYIESQVGSFSSEPAFWEHDDELNKDYVCAYAYIPRDYTKTCEIIERKGGTKNSCELCIEELAYDAKESQLNLVKFYLDGSTLLGSYEDDSGNVREIQEGMLGSRADIVQFSVENNSICTNEKLVETLDKLNETLSNFNINSMKGGNEVETDNINEVTDTEEKFSEENVEVTEETTEEVTVDEEFSEDTEVTPEVEENFDEGISGEEVTDEIVYSVEHTVVCGEKTKTFSISLNDKIYALQTLVNDTYYDDGDWYSVEVFEDTKTVQFYGWYKSYRQSYKVKNDVYSLIGDRVEIHSMWVTDDEEAKFNDMKANYSSTTEKLAEVEKKLAKYEAEPEKIEVLSSNDYKKIANTEEFAELKKRETYFDMSLDDIKAKADQILLDYAKSDKLDFAVVGKKEEVEENHSMFAFAKVEQTSSFLDGLLKK